ncbi:MAG: hypothetical protein ACJ0DD_02410, partial [Paracoccaceae bacterium]
MSIILNNLESREGLTNIPIANILGQNDAEVYSFSSGWSSLLNAFSIENNIVSLNDGWNLDFETKSVVNAQFSVNNGNINGLNYSYYNLNLPGDNTDVNIPLVRGDGLFYNEFLSFNIKDVDEGVTFTPVEQVNEGEYGITIGTVTPNSPEIFDTVNFINSNGIYSIVDNKLKIKNEYHLNTKGWLDQDPSVGIWGWNVSEEGHEHQINGDLFLNIGPKGFSPGNDDFNTGLGSTDIISVSEQMALFKNVNEQTNNIDSIPDNSLPNIIANPVNFRELYHEEIIGEFSLINSTANRFGFFKLNDPENNDFTFTETDHAFLQIIEDNENYKLALKEDFFYNKDTGRVQEKNGTGYKLEDLTSIEGVNYNSIYITALDSNDDPITTREIHFKDILENNHPDNYVINMDVGSPPWLTDIKLEKPNLPNTGREEYQKNVDYHWVLKDGEKIQYSFLDNNSIHYGTYAELEGDGLIEPTQAFKDSYEKALNNWSKFIDVQFEEIEETNENVGDWRIGITDKDHFMPGSVD